MRIETRLRGSHASLVLTGSRDDAAGTALLAELTRLLEGGVTTVDLTVRGAAPSAHPAVPVPRTPVRRRTSAVVSHWFG